jgi:hypothetical protein
MRTADELFAIIERHGVIGPPGLLKVNSLPAKQLEKLYQETFEAIYGAQLARVWNTDSSNPPDSFSFHASASIRGDSGCSAINCRGDKISFWRATSLCTRMNSSSLSPSGLRRKYDAFPRCAICWGRICSRCCCFDH